MNGVRVQCEHCSTRLSLKDSSRLGTKVKCPKCRQSFVAAPVDEVPMLHTPRLDDSIFKPDLPATADDAPNIDVSLTPTASMRSRRVGRTATATWLGYLTGHPMAILGLALSLITVVTVVVVVVVIQSGGSDDTAITGGQLENRPDGPKTAPVANSNDVIIPSNARQEAGDSVEQLLAKIVNLDFSNVPLSEVVDQISIRHSIPIYLNRRALIAVGHHVDMLITGKHGGVSLDDALSALLESYDLATYLQGDIIVVTTSADAANRFDTRVYRFAALQEVSPITQGIQEEVAPASWSVVGGPGEISFPAGTLVMIVFQSQPIHRQIQNRYRNKLTGIRLDCSKQLSREYLREIDVSLDNVPIQRALIDIGRDQGVQIEWKQDELISAGIDLDTAVTMHMNRVKVNDVLTLLLDQVDSTWIPRESGILITPKSNSDPDSVFVEAYPVSSFDEYDKAALLRTVSEIIEPRSWEHHGGAAGIRINDAGELEVRQTYWAHRQILALLEEIKNTGSIQTTFGRSDPLNPPFPPPNTSR